MFLLHMHSLALENFFTCSDIEVRQDESGGRNEDELKVKVSHTSYFLHIFHLQYIIIANTNAVCPRKKAGPTIFKTYNIIFLCIFVYFVYL